MADRTSSNIETMRILATFLLVSYHGIGPTASDALEVAYPHPLRVGSDLFIDIRMPVFAFIAGWVYGLRPVTRGRFRSFFQGKLRRLVVPGVVASLIFWLVTNTVLQNSAGGDGSLLNALTMSFVHYWFLQAIFILLMTIALVEAGLNRALPLPVLIGLAALILLSPRVAHGYIEIGGVQYLGPYFLLGVLVSRNGVWIQDYRWSVLAVAALAMCIALYMNLGFFQDNGFLNRSRRDVQSLLMASGSILLLYMLLPRIGPLAAFGSASFTIYLYHVFGTSSARRVAEFVGIDNVWLLYGVVVVAGFLLPLAAHAVLSRFNLTRTLVLGLRPRMSEAL